MLLRFIFKTVIQLLFLHPARCARLALFCCASFCLMSGQVCAQDTVTVTTNYYPVTGTSLGEVYQSLKQSRPGKEKSGWDGLTEWKINWQFNLTESAGQCRVRSFSVKTVVTITLPHWKPPTNATFEARSEWGRYLTALSQHEYGHAQFALAAHAGVKKRLIETGAQPDCDSLKKKINDGCNTIVENFKKRDNEYDERTHHGETQGAGLHVRMPPPR